MNTIKARLIAAVVLTILAAPIQSFGIVGLGIERQCTNIVISWPSQGYEHYLLQFRPTLDPSTPWENLTNNYPANSTNRTTYTIFGVAAPCFSGGGGSGAPPSSLGSFGSWSGPMVMPKDESKPPVPLGIYPPGIDLSGWIIFWPDDSTDEWSAERVEKWRASNQVEGGGGAELDGPTPGDNSGFFRVFHIPDWTFNVTNYIYDGPTFFGVDFQDYIERVENIEVLIDGVPTPDAVFFEYQTNAWGMGIYFDLFTNGTHQIQLRTTLRLSDEIGDNGVTLVLTNLARTIVVDNEVTFPNWNDLITSTNTTFQAQTKTNNTDWWIDIYDASFNYVNGGSGHTTNGEISWTWDLTDTLGNPRDDLDSDPWFYSEITFMAAAGAQTTRSTPAKQTEYPNVGDWLVTYSDKHYIDGGTNYAAGDQYYTNGIIGIAGGPALRSIPCSKYAIKFGTNSYTQTQRNDSWIDLKANLSAGRYRNFYYHGHGGPNTIGTDVHVFDTNGLVTAGTRLPGSKAFLTSQILSNEFTFNRYSGSRPFRFAWLDGCSTANGNWPGAFGVGKTTNSLSWYTNSATNPKHMRPSAFVGWNQTVGGPTWGSAQAFWNFRSEWMFDWSYNWQSRGLMQAFTNARQTANWPPGGDNRLWEALRVYGYTVIRFNEFNQKNDWRWP